MKRVLALILVVSLSGCASIPLSTMWRLRNFSPQDIARLDPAEIGVAVQLPDELALDEERVTFDIELFRKKENGDDELALEERAELETVETGQYVVTPVAPASDGRHWHVLRLSTGARESFRRFQAAFDAFQAEEGKKVFKMSVNPRFVNEHLTTGTHNVSIALQLSQSDGWFVLLDDAEIDLEERNADTD